MFEQIRDIIAEQLSLEADDIKLESSFIDDLEADSLDLFEIAMSLEEAFGVEIPSEDLEGIKTVADAIKYIESHK